jgi:hypothetical protein
MSLELPATSSYGPGATKALEFYLCGTQMLMDGKADVAEEMFFAAFEILCTSVAQAPKGSIVFLLRRLLLTCCD